MASSSRAAAESGGKGQGEEADPLAGIAETRPPRRPPSARRARGGDPIRSQKSESPDVSPSAGSRRSARSSTRTTIGRRAAASASVRTSAARSAARRGRGDAEDRLPGRQRAESGGERAGLEVDGEQPRGGPQTEDLRVAVGTGSGTRTSPAGSGEELRGEREGVDRRRRSR